MSSTKCVKRSITLSKDLDSHVLRKARRRARETGQRPNFSAALMELILADRQQAPKTA